MRVDIKKLSPEAQLPIYGTDGSAGADLTAISKELHARQTCGCVILSG
jgi:dUTPase